MMLVNGWGLPADTGGLPELATTGTDQLKVLQHSIRRSGFGSSNQVNTQSASGFVSSAKTARRASRSRKPQNGFARLTAALRE
jgi:hypothetical protein